eukprot:tig00000254_g22558.t1
MPRPSALSLETLPDDVLWKVLEHLGAADAFDSLAGASRRLRDLVYGHGTWSSLSLPWPYFRKHLASLRHVEEKKWPIVSPQRILEAWAARVEKGGVKARSFQLDTTIDWDDVDRDRYVLWLGGHGGALEERYTYGAHLDAMCDVETPHRYPQCNYGGSEFWGRVFPFLRFLRHMGPDLQSISITHGGVRPLIRLSARI